jgi:hypothetical protein
MQTFPFRVLGSAFVAVSAAVLASCAAPPQDASGVLARASEAMAARASIPCVMPPKAPATASDRPTTRAARGRRSLCIR